VSLGRQALRYLIPLLAPAALLAGPARGQDLQPGEVGAAIDRGRARLLVLHGRRAGLPRYAAARREDVTIECGNYELGHLALEAFALLRSGVTGPELSEGFAAMRRVRFKHVYCASLYAMALEARHVRRTPLDVPDRVARFERLPLSAESRGELERTAAFLVASCHRDEGVWAYHGPVPAPPPGGRRSEVFYDHSNTQFAVYALHLAAVRGIPAAADLWLPIAEHFLAKQQERGPAVDLSDLGLEPAHAAPPLRSEPEPADDGGSRTRPRSGGSSGARDREEREERERLRRVGFARGWTYRGRGSSTTAMTGAGLGSLAMATERLLERDPPLDPRARAILDRALTDGVAWFAKHWAAESAIGGGGGNYYTLWSIEKALAAVGVEAFGERRWWAEGARWLLDRQKGNGAWAADGEVRTAFALLFLNRGTLPTFEAEPEPPVVAEAPPPEAGPPDRRGPRTGAAAEPPGSWDVVEVDGRRLSVTQTLAALAAGGGRPLRGEARAAIAAMVPAERLHVVPRLLPLAESDEPVTRSWARRRLRALVGAGEPAEVRRLVDRWRRVRAIAAGGEHDAAPELAAVLRDPLAPELLQRAALAAAARLRAVEVLDAVVDHLEHDDLAHRRYAAGVLRGLAGDAAPFDPDATPPTRAIQVRAWRAWAAAEGPGLAARVGRRRDVARLGQPAEAEAAAARLRALGAEAVPYLAAALAEPAARARAHALLRELTGRDLPPRPEAWLDLPDHEPDPPAPPRIWTEDEEEDPFSQPPI